MWRFAMVMVVACGGAAPHSATRYNTDLDAVMSAATDVAKQNAKTVEVDREHATIKTAWQIVANVQEPADAYDFRGIAKVGGAAMTKYFARYDIHVIGPRPWQVVVAAHASKWLDGNVKPTELPDDSPPAWLLERRDHIVDDINARLRASAVAQQ
ncbi:MAG TPA: hypothetical protein VFQ65_26565 [Kofleriaceae bacterium]|nr:hypothetical protein [Kofleriaceae bacterium]